MSYLTIKSNITSYLSSNGYTEMLNLIEVDDAPLSYNHHSYVLKPEGFQVDALADNETITAHLLRLEIQYKNVNTTERDSNYVDFLTLTKGIAALGYFLGYTTEPTFL